LRGSESPISHQLSCICNHHHQRFFPLQCKNRHSKTTVQKWNKICIKNHRPISLLFFYGAWEG